MQLLCIGDTAILQREVNPSKWGPPGGIRPSGDQKILFNWELPVSDAVNPIPRSGGARILADLDSPRVIQSWAPGIATLATNHVLDGGENGLDRTIDRLTQCGFQTVGAGKEPNEIRKPLFWETGEGRLAIINWVFAETNPDWMRTPGPNCWPGLPEGLRQVMELKKQANWVVVVVHWSDEYFPYPLPEDRETARQLAESGADLIIGHHPHVVRGMETLAGCPVFYSLGNFHFSDIHSPAQGGPLHWAPRNREGLGVLVTFLRGKAPAWQLQSFWQVNGGTIQDPLNRAARRMEWASKPLRARQGADYSAWYREQRTRFNVWDYRWHFGLWNLSLKKLFGYPKRLFRSRASSRPSEAKG